VTPFEFMEKLYRS